MFEDLNKAQKILMIVIFSLTAVSLLMGGFSLYNLLTVEKPWTIGVAYASKIETNDKSVPIINIKIHENKNGNGETVYDMQFNSYTDTENKGIAGFGIQCVGDYAVYNKSGIKDNTIPSPLSLLSNTNEVDNYNNYKNKVSQLKYKKLNYSYIYGNFHLYYTGDNGVTYHTLPDNKVDDYLLISIGEDNYRLRLKSYSWSYLDRNAWQDFWGYGGKTVVVNTKFTWYEVFQYAMNSAKNNSGTAEFEEYSLSLFDLADYLEIQYFDEGQYKNMPSTSENRTYLTIPVNYSSKGALNSSDSLFKQIASSPTWSYYDGTSIEDYWNAYADITLTENNLNYIYDESKESYYATIDVTFANYLKGLSKSEIVLSIDLIALDFDVYGINLNDFGFKIKDFDIKTNKSDFVIYNQSNCTITPELEVIA